MKSKAGRQIICVIFLGVLFISMPNDVLAQLPPSVQKKVDEYSTKGKKYKDTGKLTTAAGYYYKAGMLCFRSGAYEQSTVYLEEAKELNLQLENFKNVQIIYSNLALAHANAGNYSRAMLFIENGLKIRKQFGTEVDYIAGLLDMAFIYAARKNYKDAILKTQEALEMSKKINNPDLTLDCFRRLEVYYRSAGNIQKSAEYSDRFALLNVQYQKKKTEKKEKELDVQKIMAEFKARESQLKYEMDLKLVEQEKEFAEDSLGLILRIKQDSIEKAALKAQQNSTQIKLLEQESQTQKALLEIEEAESRYQQRIIVAVSVAFILMFIAGFLLIINRRKIQKQRKELAKAFAVIEEQNKDINDSIHYAREIQKAFLPNQADLSLLFKESFIFFEPRDVVSGDYYWFTKFIIKNDDGSRTEKHFAAAIDCTGHGVPGALLSMTGFNIIESIVHDKKIHEPAKIMDNLHEEIRKKLRQNETPNRDGMDMAMIAYTPETKELQFAGAKNPLILIQNEKLTRVKGDIKPIGGEIFEPTEKKTFTQHTITLESTSTIYLFSDGFADQIGGKNGRKYMKNRFRDYLAGIHQKPFKEQAELLSKEFKNWKGNNAQIDDVLVMGIKLDP